MLNQEKLKTIKRTNISADAGKTSQRVQDLWKNATDDEKNAIISSADVTASTVQRIYKVGCISAKLAAAIGQELNVDPAYLAGEIDDPLACSDDALQAFLTAKGYGDLFKKKPGRKPKKPDEAGMPELEDDAPTPEPPAAAVTEPEQAAARGLTEDEYALLIRALLLQAELGGIEAKNKLKALNGLLL